ncbi:MAG: hypothetical protein NXY57DRAFT_565786 [Lentinula lateritia]|uniref:Secreted protein n=1 Tax=Lentinula lateritia TaxID=40482 RepID=A0ABQ8V2H8_9AGAR|nr:MAG: hypothetical protein NXY57DRAFT_565786 [Lentinula lateritia]KAJ4463523.1 hypothetical protein C8R41DRAFT_154788 [Lentinula lateritia]
MNTCRLFWPTQFSIFCFSTGSIVSSDADSDVLYNPSCCVSFSFYFFPSYSHLSLSLRFQSIFLSRPTERS